MSRHPYSPLTPNRVDWRSEAACDGLDTALFYLPDGARRSTKRFHEQRAKAVCSRCPVIQQCRNWALRTEERWGVWGGLTPEERDAVLRASA